MPNPSTLMSTRGQVVLPKSVRDAKGWTPGCRLEVVATPEGVLLRTAVEQKRYTIDEVVGMLKYDGPPISIEEMDAAVLREAARSFEASVREDD